ncbi:MAG: universal stress protein [Syntrophaceae bacterium]|nr:universal stress protein [Syntrophaceae bacterium]
MYKNVLVPLDGSELAEVALSHVKNLVKDGLVEEVTIMNVFATPVALLGAGGDSSAYVDVNAVEEKMKYDSLKYLVDVKARLDAEGVKVTTESLEGSRAAEVICDYAQKNNVDLIVLGTHGYTGLKKLMFGSVALEVLHCSHVPVFLVRPESCWMK